MKKIHILIIPIAMLLVSFVGFLVLCLGSESHINFVYYIYVSLFFWVPISTIGFVLKKIPLHRRKNIFLRMIISSTPGVALLLFPNHTLLKIIAVGGIIYFTYDVKKQHRVLDILLKRPSHILNNGLRLRKIMQTNCSRKVLRQWAKYYHPHPKSINQKIYRSGYRWWHCFPVSKEPLWKELFFKQKKI